MDTPVMTFRDFPARRRDRTGPRPARRGRVDPTTFEKVYTRDEVEFMLAMQQFKERNGKAHPTCGEILRVAASLGYRPTGGPAR